MTDESELANLVSKIWACEIGWIGCKQGGPNKNGAFTSHTVEDWNAILDVFPPWHVVDSKLLQTTTAMKISKPTPEENKI